MLNVHTSVTGKHDIAAAPCLKLYPRNWLYIPFTAVPNSFKVSASATRGWCQWSYSGVQLWELGVPEQTPWNAQFLFYHCSRLAPTVTMLCNVCYYYYNYHYCCYCFSFSLHVFNFLFSSCGPNHASVCALFYMTSALLPPMSHGHDMHARARVAIFLLFAGFQAKPWCWDDGWSVCFFFRKQLDTWNWSQQRSSSDFVCIVFTVFTNAI